ncbi:MAG TPA: ABC transporter ATP-binding protein [Geminicoccaceae bacterium]|nr:ABC transporter ATP-binding protein [Geminicoccaceae bacterium]
MLEVEALEVRFGAVRAVHGVSLRVAAGEILAVLGANGAGKSSTLLAIAGALRPTAGRVQLEGQDVTGAAPEEMVRRGVAMVPETRGVFSDLTVAENLRLGGFVRRHDLAGAADDRTRLFELFPVLAERRDQPAGTLSGGEQQMLVIARAMMSRPRLLLLDEPSLGLAPAIVDRLFQQIVALRQGGVTVLLVEQNARKALDIADRAYVLRLGEVAAEGPASEIAAATDLKALYLGGPA